VRPQRLVLVVGTGTEVGKTWVSARLLTALRNTGVTVAARKPSQSFEPGTDPAEFDSAILGGASGEPSGRVCPPARCYPTAMAPPMAAEALGKPRFVLAELVEELAWPGTPVDLGLVETAGGVRSPQTHDADAVGMATALAPDLVLLVADAGLGTLNAVRLSLGALAGGAPVAVVLNRYDERDGLHVRNRGWLTERDGTPVITMPGEDEALVRLALGS
jgi:dethiobiotin synthetase